MLSTLRRILGFTRWRPDRAGEYARIAEQYRQAGRPAEARAMRRMSARLGHRNGRA